MLTYAEIAAAYAGAVVTATVVNFAYMAWVGHQSNKIFQRQLDKLR